MAVNVPVKFAADEIVWPLIRPELTSPVLSEVEKRLVEEEVVNDAPVAKRLVVVELVEVDCSAVKFWSVVEEFTWSCPGKI